MAYLDNAATTFPKPPGVMEKALAAYRRFGASPGRGGHRLARRASEALEAARDRLAGFFGLADPNRLVYTGNITDALNLAIRGLVKPGARVLTTQAEHNSVLRPLAHLHRDGRASNILRLTVDPTTGRISRADADYIIRHLELDLIVVQHGSNVLGTLQPVEEISEVARQAGIPILIDAAQTAGAIPITVRAHEVWAWTGHKSLLGPTGIGGLAVGADVDIAQVRVGGSGRNSEAEFHPTEYPYRLEAGTHDLLGILMLDQSLRWIMAHGGPVKIHAGEMDLALRLWDALAKIPLVKLYVRPDLPVVLFNVRGQDPAEVAARLDARGVACRAGLHCAPGAHAAIGTLPRGAVRLSVGPFNTEAHIRQAVRAVRAIVEGR